MKNIQDNTSIQKKLVTQGDEVDWTNVWKKRHII